MIGIRHMSGAFGGGAGANRTLFFPPAIASGVRSASATRAIVDVFMFVGLFGFVFVWRAIGPSFWSLVLSACSQAL